MIDRRFTEEFTDLDQRRFRFEGPEVVCDGLYHVRRFDDASKQLFDADDRWIEIARFMR